MLICGQEGGPMRSDKQIQASKINGARSRGPITQQGKRNSSRNSTRHGLLTQAVVLEEESAHGFEKLLADFTHEYRPRTATQVSLVEIMAVTRCRQLRVRLAQRAAADRDIAGQHRSVGRRSRALLALLGSPASSRLPEVLHRYEVAFDRQFSRALTNSSCPSVASLRQPNCRPNSGRKKDSAQRTWALN